MPIDPCLLQSARAFPPDAVQTGQIAVFDDRKGVNDMNQEDVAGIILCVMGLALLLIPPNTWWRVAEKWKTEDGSGPTKSYTVSLHVLGVLFFGAGIALALSSL